MTARSKTDKTRPNEKHRKKVDLHEESGTQGSSPTLLKKRQRSVLGGDIGGSGPSAKSYEEAILFQEARGSPKKGALPQEREMGGLGQLLPRANGGQRGADLKKVGKLRRWYSIVSRTCSESAREEGGDIKGRKPEKEVQRVPDDKGV